MKDLKVIILAAGRGTRLNKGVASPIPKVLYEIGNKPIILYLLETLKKINSKKPILVVGYQADKVKKIVGNKADYVWQKKQLGTGNAVLSVKDNLKAQIVMVLCGDMPFLSDVSIKKLIELHKKEKPIITLLTVKFNNPNHYAFGRIMRSKDGEICAIIEQKNATDKERKIKECNSGVYIFDAHWLWDNIDKIKKNPQSGEYYLTDLIEMAINQNQRVVGLKSKNQKEFLGVNTLKQLEEAEKIIS